MTTTVGETTPVEVPAESSETGLTHAQMARIVAEASLAKSRVSEMALTRDSECKRIPDAAQVEVDEESRWFLQETEADRRTIAFAEAQVGVFMRARLAADPEGKKSTCWRNGRVSSLALAPAYERDEPKLFAWAEAHGFTRTPEPRPVTDWERLMAATETMDDARCSSPRSGPWTACDASRVIPRSP